MTTSQDFDRLSAYLDNQLSPREKARLEARLAQDAELKGVLDDLRGVKRALRILPILKVPRNFTLTAAQAGQRAPARYPVLQFAAALASLAFVVVFAGDLALGLSAGSGAAAPAPEVAAVQQSSAADAGSATESAPPPTVEEGARTLAAMAPSETPSPESGPSAKLSAAPTETPAAAFSGTPLPPPSGIGGGGGGNAGDSGVPAAGPTITPAFPTITLAPSETPSAEQYAAPAEAPAASPLPIRSIEITLGVLAVVLIAAAFLLRR